MHKRRARSVLVYLSALRARLPRTRKGLFRLEVASHALRRIQPQASPTNPHVFGPICRRASPHMAPAKFRARDCANRVCGPPPGTQDCRERCSESRPSNQAWRKPNLLMQRRPRLHNRGPSTREPDPSPLQCRASRPAATAPIVQSNVRSISRSPRTWRSPAAATHPPST